MLQILNKNLKMGCIRMKRKKVWILSGVPGSGKTTWARKQIQNYGGVHCSRDEVRFSLLKDNEDYFAHEDEVWDLWIKSIIDAINNPEVTDIYVDATHLNEKSREKVLKLLPIDKEKEVVTVIFNISLEKCLENNEKRKNQGRAYVPRDVIIKMYSSFNGITNLTPFMVINEGDVLK